MKRRCPKCGAEVELTHMKSGQRLLVNPGFVMVFTGSDSSGGVTMGRVLHRVTCEASGGLAIDQDGCQRITDDGSWKSEAERRAQAEARRPQPKRKGRRR